MKQQSSTKRIYYYDILRAFAIFCIVSCHVFATYVKNMNIFGTKFWYYSIALNSLRDIGVPLFILLSGCLLLNRKDTITSFVKKRIGRVVPPYIFWALIFCLYALLVSYYGIALLHFSNLTDLFLKVFSLNPPGAATYLWFVPMILTVYLIIFLINKLNEHFKHTLTISLILSVLLIIANNLNLITFDLPYKYVFFTTFAIIGYYIDNIDFSHKISPKYLYIIFALIFIISYLLEIYLNASTSLNLNRFTSISKFNLINIIAVCSIFLFIKYLTESYETNEYNSNISKIVLSISTCSYGIYLSHMIMKSILLEFILCNVKSLMPDSIFSALTLIITFSCSWLLIWILSKIPHIKNVCGAS